MKAGQETEELMKDFVEVQQNVNAVRVDQVNKRGEVDVEIAGIRYRLHKIVADELLGGLSRAVRPYAGYSIFDRIMEELDAVIDRLMSGDGAAADDRDPGRAEAFCRSLALIRNPYQPDYDGERERQMDRYEQRNGETP